jgi:hypothetical protein
MCENILRSLRYSVHEGNSDTLRQESASNSFIGDQCRVTTEDATGIDENIKRMKGMS